MFYRTIVVGLLFLAPPLLRAGEVLDSVVVVVNGHAILQSDWQDEIRYESFVAGRLPTDVTPDRKAALDRLIDQELLREQANTSEVKATSSEEIDNQFAIVKDDYVRAHSTQTWSDALASYHLTEADIKSHIGLELFQLRLVDAHLRPSIQIDPDEIATYYKDHLPPSSPDTKPTSLKEATPKIRELLTQEKINESLSSWLDSLHSQAEIRILVSNSSDTQGLAQ